MAKSPSQSINGKKLMKYNPCNWLEGVPASGQTFRFGPYNYLLRPLAGAPLLHTPIINLLANPLAPFKTPEIDSLWRRESPHVVNQDLEQERGKNGAPIFSPNSSAINSG